MEPGAPWPPVALAGTGGPRSPAGAPADPRPGQRPADPAAGPVAGPARPARPAADLPVRGHRPPPAGGGPRPVAGHRGRGIALGAAHPARAHGGGPEGGARRRGADPGGQRAERTEVPPRRTAGIPHGRTGRDGRVRPGPRRPHTGYRAGHAPGGALRHPVPPRGHGGGAGPAGPLPPPRPMPPAGNGRPRRLVPLHLPHPGRARVAGRTEPPGQAGKGHGQPVLRSAGRGGQGGAAARHHPHHFRRLPAARPPRTRALRLLRTGPGPAARCATGAFRHGHRDHLARSGTPRPQVRRAGTGMDPAWPGTQERGRGGQGLQGQARAGQGRGPCGADARRSGQRGRPATGLPDGRSPAVGCARCSRGGDRRRRRRFQQS